MLLYFCRSVLLLYLCIILKRHLCMRDVPFTVGFVWLMSNSTD